MAVKKISEDASRPPAQAATGRGRSGWAGPVFGFVTGIVLSALYIQFDWTLPGWLQFPGLVKAVGPRSVADAVLEDPGASMEARQRAVEELLRHDPNLFQEVDDALGFGVTQAVIDRKARRSLVLFQSKQRTMREKFRTDLSNLRGAAMRKYGVNNLEDLMVHAGMEDIQGEPFFHHWLQTRFPGMNDEELVRMAMELSPNEVFPPPPGEWGE